MTVPVLPNGTARHLFLAKHGLAGRPSGAGKGADLKAVIDGLGFVQLDSVNTFARAHDLILWSRRQQYRPQALQHLLHRDRQVFEHWTHDAAVIPMESFAHWRLRFARDEARLASRWRNDRRDDFHAKIAEVL
ncbi:MAG: winged helix DNA-binding domain-containing protein [Paracoccaceae bacterium]|nr:winged helix DNA-binding domain-containing protein [Paracoccaceae bacterium]